MAFTTTNAGAGAVPSPSNAELVADIELLYRRLNGKWRWER